MVAMAFALLVGAGATDTKKETKKEGDKVIKGSVPIGWGKALKLSKDQSKAIQKIDVEYKTKIAELNKKIAELTEQSRIEMTKQLTDDQKATLAKLAGIETKDKEKDKDKEKPKENKDKDK
jgi:TolA-binding protein